MNTIKSTDTLVALDIGTSKVLCLVADIDDKGELRIIGIGNEPCAGLNKGVISEIDATVSSVRRAKEKASSMSSCNIESVTTGIAGNHIQSYNGNGAVNIMNDEVTEEDKEKVIANAQNIQIPKDQEILHVIDQYYTIDGQTGIREPKGMAGGRLEANVHIITTSSTAKRNLTKCINNSLLEIDHFVLQPVASSLAVLSDEELDLGVCLIDIGCGTTDVAIFTEGTIKHTAVIPIGSQMITNDIRIILCTSLDAAEQIKIQYGCVSSNQDMDLKIPVPSVSDKPDTETSKTIVSQIIAARINEIFDAIQKEINDSGYSNKIRAGLVFTGGGAKLGGIDNYAESFFKTPSRVGSPKNIKGLEDLRGKTRYSTAVGLLLYREKELRKLSSANKYPSKIANLFNKVTRKLSNYFQKEL
ncbi:MAG: cell division protein FtsA [Gammaproteobacteria bacterium]|nr:cell division protein FtsA [Gammaproteobacteria bacterium]MBL6819145.1 cell division protein FtsA [Gammaproteobacteria bacterium]MBL6898796.1 cell division protein FtsA [Gammaproteobacteria bacterium]